MQQTEFFIDDIAIDEPLNIGGFFLMREVASRMNGSIYKQRGQTEGVDNLAITSQDAISMILGLQDTQLTEAIAEFRAMRYGNELFSSNVDFSSVRQLRNGGIEINLKDKEAETFIENIDTVYELELGNNETFSSETVFTDYSLGLDGDKIRIQLSSIQENRQINPIFKADNKATLLGSLLETEDFNNRSFYKNSTGAKIRLNMSLELTGTITVSAAAVIVPKIVIRDTNNNIVYSVDVTTINVTGTKPFAVIEEYSIDIPVDASVAILFQINNPLSSAVFTFSSDAQVNLSEGDLSNIEIPIITVNDALAQLVARASNGLFGLEVFAGLSHLRMCPYAVVRGRAGKLNISFGQLWDDLNTLFCLKIDQIGPNLVISSYEESFENVNPFVISDISEYSIDTDFSNLYNEIKLGFNRWKSENDAGVPEATAPINLVTSLKSAPSPLDLTVKTLVASLKMLSEAFLMRNRAGAENENTDKDQQIFLLSADPAKPITSLTPLNSWVKVIGNYHGALTKASGEGAYMNLEYQADFTGIPAIFAPRILLMSCNMETEDYISIGDFVKVIDVDREFTAYVTEIRHYPMAINSPEKGNTAIKGRLLSQSYA